MHRPYGPPAPTRESIENMMDRWLACVARLENEIPAQQFKPWIKPLVFLGYDATERVLRLGVPNHFKLNWVKSQFESRIESIARETIEPELRVTFEIHREPAPVAPALPSLDALAGTGAWKAPGASPAPNEASRLDDSDVVTAVPETMPEAAIGFPPMAAPDART